MRSSENGDKLSMALVNVSAKVKNLKPSAKGYGYDYVPLEDVIDHLRGILPTEGLTYIQLPTGGDDKTTGLSTRIIHSSGQWIESDAVFPFTDMKGVNRSQASGAALSYFRRYALCSAFGITGDADIDMHGDTDYTSELDDIARAATLDDLFRVWTTIFKIHGHVPELEKAKNKRKGELS